MQVRGLLELPIFAATPGAETEHIRTTYALFVPDGSESTKRATRFPKLKKYVSLALLKLEFHQLCRFGFFDMARFKLMGLFNAEVLVQVVAGTRE